MRKLTRPLNTGCVGNRGSATALRLREKDAPLESGSSGRAPAPSPHRRISAIYTLQATQKKRLWNPPQVPSSGRWVSLASRVRVPFGTPQGPVYRSDSPPLAPPNHGAELPGRASPRAGKSLRRAARTAGARSAGPRAHDRLRPPRAAGNGRSRCAEAWTAWTRGEVTAARSARARYLSAAAGRRSERTAGRPGPTRSGRRASAAAEQNRGRRPAPSGRPHWPPAPRRRREPVSHRLLHAGPQPRRAAPTEGAGPPGVQPPHRPPRPQRALCTGLAPPPGRRPAPCARRASALGCVLQAGKGRLVAAAT